MAILVILVILEFPEPAGILATVEPAARRDIQGILEFQAIRDILVFQDIVDILGPVEHRATVVIQAHQVLVDILDTQGLVVRPVIPAILVFQGLVGTLAIVGTLE